MSTLATEKKLRLTSEQSIFLTCCLMVLMSNVCLMVMEFAGSRVLGKSLGQSLYTWTSLIGVVLTGMSVGNYLGGWLADRRPPGKILAVMFAASAALTLAIPFLHGIIGMGGKPDYAPWWAYVFMTTMGTIFLPSVTLGAIPPVAATYMIRHSTRIGSAVGMIYSCGALGSIFGTFIMGFSLVQYFRVTLILSFTAATLLLVGGLCWLLLGDVPAPARPTVVRDKRISDTLAIFWCNLTVFFVNVVFMALELVASRIVSMRLGHSLYSWTAVIGVILAGITLGNWLGGLLSSSTEIRNRIGTVLTLAALFTLLIFPSSNIVGPRMYGATNSGIVTEDFIEGIQNSCGFIGIVLLQVSSMFLLPSIAIGTVSPMMARYVLRFTNHPGSAIGGIYLWGAIGSIVGTFLTGYFLIDQLGTYHLLWMISASLALVGAITLTDRFSMSVSILTIFLAAIVGVAATVKLPYSNEKIEEFRLALKDDRIGAPEKTRIKRSLALQDFVYSSHRLAKHLYLRSDELGEYYDESNYSYINVGEVEVDNVLVKSLVLDHLTHSYYDDKNPTKLYYDYELVYAELTENASARASKSTEARLPGGLDIAPFLKDYVAGPGLNPISWDPLTRKLSVQGALSEKARLKLLNASPSGPFYLAFKEIEKVLLDIEKKLKKMEELDNEEQLIVEKNLPPYSTPLSEMPAGFELPESVAADLNYSSELQELMVTSRLSQAERDLVFKALPDHAYHSAVEELYRRSRAIDTLFLGGGGFVFPRWVESRFPGSKDIQVLELDPAVLKAVEENLGFEPTESRVQTRLGDARNSVDDLLRENVTRVKNKGAPILYDFVYGDAFNDFSVPWHLTTFEFTVKASKLLKQEGALLANIIDIYPRVQYIDPYTQVWINLPPPKSLLDLTYTTEEWRRLRGTNLFISVHKDDGTFNLLVEKDPLNEDPLNEDLLSDSDYKILYQAIGDYEDEKENNIEQPNNDPGRPGNPIPRDKDQEKMTEYLAGIEDLRIRANSAARVKLPEVLIKHVRDETGRLMKNKLSKRVDWIAGPKGMEALEIHLYNDTFGLGYRGPMSIEVRDELLNLSEDPDYRKAINFLYEKSQLKQGGAFLGAYTATLSKVFPNVYVFSSNKGRPSKVRDTFIVAGSFLPLNMADMGAADFWSEEPFASLERDSLDDESPVIKGQWNAIMSLARGVILEDDYAPTDVLLLPVFQDR